MTGNVIAFPGVSVTEPEPPVAPPAFDEWSPEVTAHLTSLIVDLDDLDEDEYRQRMAHIAECAGGAAERGESP